MGERGVTVSIAEALPHTSHAGPGSPSDVRGTGLTGGPLGFRDACLPPSLGLPRGQPLGSDHNREKNRGAASGRMGSRSSHVFLREKPRSQHPERTSSELSTKGLSLGSEGPRAPWMREHFHQILLGQPLGRGEGGTLGRTPHRGHRFLLPGIRTEGAPAPAHSRPV